MDGLRQQRDQAQNMLNEKRRLYDDCYLNRLHQMSSSSSGAFESQQEAAAQVKAEENDCEKQYEEFKKSFENLQKLDDLVLRAESEERSQRDRAAFNAAMAEANAATVAAPTPNAAAGIPAAGIPAGLFGAKGVAMPTNRKN